MFLFMSLDLACFLNFFLLFSFLRRLLWVFYSTVVGPDHDLDPESHTSCECRRSFSMSWSCAMHAHHIATRIKLKYKKRQSRNLNSEPCGPSKKRQSRNLNLAPFGPSKKLVTWSLAGTYRLRHGDLLHFVIEGRVKRMASWETQNWSTEENH